MWVDVAMRRLADPSRCPDCSATLAPGAPRCPACGLVLTGAMAQELFITLSRADDLLDRLRQQPTTGALGPSGAPPFTPAAPGPPGGPVPSPIRRSVPVVRASSVPKILLALGAGCLLVAALVFLAVAWSVLGVAGRTTVLVVLTVGASLLTAWTAGRGLRGAVEALGLVTLGLAALDLIGARNAGWLGQPSDGTFLVVLGLALTLAGLASTEALTRTAAHGFTGGEVAAVLGVALVPVGVTAQDWGSTAGRLTLATVIAVLAAALMRVAATRGAAGLRLARSGAAVVAAVTWLALLGAGVDHVGDRPGLGSVWGHLDAWPLLAAAAVGLGVALAPWPPTGLRVLGLSGALLALGAAATAPAWDEDGTTTTVAALVVVVVAAAVLVLAPRPWSLSALGPGAVGSVYPAVMVLLLGGAALEQYADAVARLWRGRPGGRFVPPSWDDIVPSAWVLPLCVAILGAFGWAVLRAVRRTRRRPGDTAHRPGIVPVVPTGRAVALTIAAVLALSGVATLLLYPVPVWLVVAVLLAGALTCAVPAVRRDDPAAGVLMAGALVAALLLGLYDEQLTLAATVVSGVIAAAAHLRTARSTTAAISGATAPPLAAALVWTLGAVVHATGTWVALVGLLVLAALALGRPGVPARTSTESARAVVEVAAALGAVPLALAGLAAAPSGREATWTAIYLTVAGGAAAAMALLQEDRRWVGWLGGLLLAAGSWVRLADLGVHAPEPYTLPAAVALLGLGVLRLRRDERAGTLRALTPGLTLALVPSLLWVLDDPLTARALVLGLVCVVLVIAGVQARWSAPLLGGALAGAVLVVREAAPYVGAAVPRWGLIGTAGLLLIVLGVTWEQRLQEAREVSGRLRMLR
ncbi:MAG: hypothetical protein QOK15_1091 [Nocardioidaceae bacterium]|nr:hypothetical protein [Nocardioidaceae bacterium]